MTENWSCRWKEVLWNNMYAMRAVIGQYPCYAFLKSKILISKLHWVLLCFNLGYFTASLKAAETYFCCKFSLPTPVNHCPLSIFKFSSLLSPQIFPTELNKNAPSKRKERIGGQSSILAASGWITKDADQRGQVERHIEGAFGSRHTTTNHGSQLGSRCWFYGERKTEEPRRKTKKHFLF